MMKLTPYEKTAERLLRGQPRAKPFGKLIGNQWMVGTKSLHRTPQSVKWRAFWRLKSNRNQPLRFYNGCQIQGYL